MKVVTKIVLLLLLSSGFSLSSQTAFTRYGIGLNFVPLYSGTPELQLDYFPLKKLGISSNIGYTYKARRGGFVKVGDQAAIYELKGYFLKLGLKFRTSLNSGKDFVFFGQIFYVFSHYNESGTKYESIDPTPRVNYTGFVNGIAATAGIEIRLLRFVHFRGGIQFGTYSSRAHLGYPGHTFQPGLGASGQIMNNQLVLGLVCKFGHSGK